MLKITILRNGTITNAASFESQELLDSWYATHVESFGESHEALVSDISAQLEQEAINASAKAYLEATDYLILREMDAGTPCPPEVRQARAEARAKIK